MMPTKAVLSRIAFIGLSRSLVVIAALFFGTAYAATKCVFFDKFVDNKDGTVTDPRNGLVWKRCAEGFSLTGNTCTGSSTRLNWHDAVKAAGASRFLGKSDWRIPSRDEFSTVMGRFMDCRLHNNHADKGEYAVSRMLAHPVPDPRYKENFPGTFWTSTHPSYGKDRDHIAKAQAYYASFFLGLIDVNNLDGQQDVRFVRSSR